MATPPVPPQPLPSIPNFEPNLPPMAPTPPQQPPATDMTGICFRDQLWLNTYPLDRGLVFDYFALSPFYDWTCNNEQLRKMTGTEYMLSEVTEPHLFVIRKQKRDSAEKVTPMLTYYVLDGSIYQAPQLSSVFSARIGWALYYISKAFSTAASKLEKIGYLDSENEGVASESKTGKEVIDFKEVKRIDHILASLQRKLPLAPLPPPFPEGYVLSPSAEAENGPETQQAGELQPPVDPIIDQGPAERIKF